MNAAASASLGHQIGESIVKVCIAIVGLLVLRGILSVMPMLREDPVWVPDFQQTAARALADQYPLYSEAIRGMLQAVLDPSQPPVPKGMSATKYEETKKVWASLLISQHLAIYPITIAKAVVDTLIFGLLFLFGFSLASVYRSQYPRLPDLGQMLNLGILTVVVGIAYYSYQGVAYPFLFPDNSAIYGWVFLVLVLAPLVALAVVVARNMDGLTAIVIHSGSAIATVPTTSVTTRCSNCGQPIAVGVKFCSNCGIASVTTASTKKQCSSCGTENLPTAKFCKECGQTV